MEPLAQHQVSCPYCGEPLDVIIDQQDAGQQYIEDCQVCCRPIVFLIGISADGLLDVTVHDENDAI